MQATSETATTTTTTTGKEYPKWHSIVSGAVAGAGARLFTAPLDLLKIRRQLSLHHPPSTPSPPLSAGAASASLAAASASAAAAAQSASTNPTKQTTMGLLTTLPQRIPFLQSFQKIIQNEGGIQSLFRGNIAATYLWVGYAAVQFSLYARTSEFLTSFGTSIHVDGGVQPHIPPSSPSGISSGIGSNISSNIGQFMHTIGSNPTAVAFCAGATAGTAATIATYPFDICRTAFAARGSSATLSSFFTSAIRDGGTSTGTGSGIGTGNIITKLGGPTTKAIRTLFAGCGPAILQIIPYMGINFAIYDYLCRQEVKNGQQTKVMNAGMAGAIAGGTSKLIVYPLDTVKKRLQAQSFTQFWNMPLSSGASASSTSAGVGAGVGVGMGVNGKPQYKHMVDCIVRMSKEEGIVAFYRGLVPTVMKSMCATSITFAMFTLTKNSLETLHDSMSRLKEVDEKE